MREMSNIDYVALPLFLGLVWFFYWLLSRTFRRIIDPTGEYGLSHDLPLPGLVRWIILVIATLIPVLLASILAGLLHLLV
jgi:hypothetical protein